MIGASQCHRLREIRAVRYTVCMVELTSFAATAVLATISVWVTGAGLVWLYVLVNRLAAADPRRWWWNRLLREHIVFLWSWTVPFRWLWLLDVPPPGVRGVVLTIISLAIVLITGKFLRDQRGLWMQIRA